MPLNVVLIFFQFAVLCFALSLHECAHAWTAWRLGDPTAYMLGRVTLNPFKQLTPIGSVALPLIGMFFGLPLIGWAKPTPVTPRNFKNYKRDDILVTLAGPAVNLSLAIICLLLLIITKHAFPGGPDLIDTTAAVAYQDPDVNLATLPTLFPLALLLYFGILTNVALFLFNLIPIPPLDGSHILRHYLPYKASQMYDSFSAYGMIFLYFIVARLHVLNAVYTPVLRLFDWLLVKL
ncbi:MAG: site-2 protease family protein, partial [Acidobacteriota bacterium]